MPNELTKIKRAIREQRYEFGIHCLHEIADDDLTLREIVSSVLAASDFDLLTDDPSNVRFRIFGVSKTGRYIVSIVIYSNRRVFFKTVYEA